LARFEGTKSFVATDDLKVAVNAAVTLQRPLLIKGEPGTGKTVLAQEVANALGKALISWHIKSTTKAQQGLYEYDAVSRLRDSQLGDARVHDIGNYIIHGKLWDAFEAADAPVLLIDEIDKADIEFPNDLLLELDRMEFFVYETRQTIKAKQRPVIIITSNNEKELPDAFLRRCFFHYIKFPDRETMERIVGLEETAFDIGISRLAEIADGGGYRAGSAEGKERRQADPAAAWRAAEERAGCASFRTPGLSAPARRVTPCMRPNPVMPAKAGIHDFSRSALAPCS
jgi:MoxR-like ATPase